MKKTIYEVTAEHLCDDCGDCYISELFDTEEHAKFFMESAKKRYPTYNNWGIDERKVYDDKMIVCDLDYRMIPESEMVITEHAGFDNRGNVEIRQLHTCKECHERRMHDESQIKFIKAIKQKRMKA